MRRTLLLSLLLSLISTGCTLAGPSNWLQGPTPVPGAGEVPVPSADVHFLAHAPASTTTEAQLAVEVVDPVTGVGYKPQRSPMVPTEGGSWEANLSLPIGSLIRYRYVRTAPSSAHERTSSGEIVQYRLAIASGAIQLEDTIASWQAETEAGPKGRVLGRVIESGSGQPVAEMIVSAAGQMTFTDSEGRFRLEGLVPGLHNVVAHHPNGAYEAIQQGAIVAQESTTPAEFTVESAALVTITFQLTVPEGTTGTPRMAGSVLSLGAVFSPLPGGVEVSGARMPELVRVDERHFIGLQRLYAGTDLRYKYSLGDGLWNAERDEAGAFITRQLIVPETDTIIEDRVVSWRSSGDPLSFTVEAPPNTPTGDEVGLQFNPFDWFEPLPMPASEGREWAFELYGPLGMGDAVSYRYCRNLVCGAAGEEDPGAGGRSLDPAEGTAANDSISAWAWWRGPPEELTLDEPEITPRPDLSVGVDLVPIYRPSWVRYDRRSMERVAELGTNAVTFTPTWVAVGDPSHPRLEFDPTQTRFGPELKRASTAARQFGLSVSLRPELVVQENWWQDATRDTNWWVVFFDELRSFLLTQGVLAEQVGADTLVITGAQLAPALPGGSLPDGQNSRVPPDAYGRWTAILADLRAVYSGRLAFEVELRDDLMDVPPFLEEFDAIHVYWHAPLTNGGEAASLDELQREAQRYWDLELIPVLPAGTPVALSLEYVSVEDSAAACPTDQTGGCLPPEALDLGAEGTLSAEVDLAGQADTLRAVLRAVADEEQLSGISLRRFNPVLALQDKSASVYGKPAAAVLEYWYPHLRGEPPEP